MGVRTTRSSSRRAQVAENAADVPANTTRLYGTPGKDDLAAQMRERDEMQKAVGTIEGGLGTSAQVEGTERQLSTVAEEERMSDHGSMRGNSVSGTSRARNGSQLTGLKSFEKENSIAPNIHGNRNVDEWVSHQPGTDTATQTTPKRPLAQKLIPWDLLLTLSYGLFWLSLTLPILASSWMAWKWGPIMNALVRNNVTSSIPASFDAINHRFDTASNGFDHRIEKVEQSMVKLEKSIQRTEVEADQTRYRLGSFYEEIYPRLNTFENRYRMYQGEVKDVHDQLGRFERTFARNVQPKFYRVNYFSHDLGARVNSYLTSPTIIKPVKVMRRSPLLSFGFWFGDTPMTDKKMYASMHHDQALKPWSEPLDRWCAPSTRGKLQLAVTMPRPITPEELVIEHFPRQQLMSIGAAPQEFELWIRITNDDVRDEILRAIIGLYPDIMTREASQEGKTLDRSNALDNAWIPVGRWIYSISALENIQRFPLRLNLKPYNVAVREAIVRVNSNWGSLDSTCLYRVVMHGEDKSGIKEYLEDPSTDW